MYTLTSSKGHWHVKGGFESTRKGAMTATTTVTTDDNVVDGGDDDEGGDDDRGDGGGGGGDAGDDGKTYYKPYSGKSTLTRSYKI